MLSPSATPRAAWLTPALAGLCAQGRLRRRHSGSSPGHRPDAWQRRGAISGWLNPCARSISPRKQKAQYNQYLALSNFDSGMAGKLSYYLGGYLLGYGVKKRAAQADIWKELRGQANTGLCDCEWLQKSSTRPSIIARPRSPSRQLTFSPTTGGHSVLRAVQQFGQRGPAGRRAQALSECHRAESDANEADRSRKYVRTHRRGARAAILPLHP